MAINSMFEGMSVIISSEENKLETAIRTPPPVVFVFLSRLKILKLLQKISPLKILLFNQVSVNAIT